MQCYNLRMMKRDSEWPELPFAKWKDTYATLHLWTQMVGKYRLILNPWINHSWHATFYLTSRGLTSSPIPYKGDRFQMDFDFVRHLLEISREDGTSESIELRPRSVADFYGELTSRLHGMGIDVAIHKIPNEMVDPLPFDQDERHASYDREYANRWWRALMNMHSVFQQFRSRFIGKCSPVHFFWGSFDLAVTRFSGRRAPEHPGGVPNLPDWVAKEAYSHEVSSCGFWPGSEQVPSPAFYCYGYPEPEGFKEYSKISPSGAYYHNDLREYILPYDEVRNSKDPADTLLQFLQSSYEATANLAKWDRASLEVQNEFRPDR